MRKTYRLDGEICANCASKIQTKISRLPGVNTAFVNAMTYKFTLDADDASFDEALGRSIKIFSDIEPDAEVLV